MSPGSPDDVAKPVKQVMKMRLPSVMGLDAPGPGNVVFHTMFLLSAHVRGSALVPRPIAPGPRNCGQSVLLLCAANGQSEKATTNKTAKEPAREHRLKCGDMPSP